MLILSGLGLVVFLATAPRDPGRTVQTHFQNQGAPVPHAMPSSSNGTASTASPHLKAVGSNFVLRPFPVARESQRFQWTDADGMDTNVIRRLAHNEMEHRRMVEENSRIKRRQLVYEKVTVPMLVERAIGAGQSLQIFTLPGFDGKEIDVEVTEVNLKGTVAGSLNGRVKGRLNSIVSVGFYNGCESFNVVSPDDGLNLAADAREPGEVMLKEIDPDKFGGPPQTAPDFILTEQPAPGQHPAPIPPK